MTRRFSEIWLLRFALSLAIFGMVILPLFAVPGERLRMTITLTDGTSVEVTRVGDEYFSYYLTDDGEAVVQDSMGYRLLEDAYELQLLMTQASSRRQAARRKGGSAATAP